MAEGSEAMPRYLVMAPIEAHLSEAFEKMWHDVLLGTGP